MRAFCHNDLGVVCQAMGVAEESVSDYYRLSDAAWRDYPYELRTLAQLQSGEVTYQALAQILRLTSRKGRGACGAATSTGSAFRITISWGF